MTVLALSCETFEILEQLLGQQLQVPVSENIFYYHFFTQLSVMKLRFMSVIKKNMALWHIQNPVEDLRWSFLRK